MECSLSGSIKMQLFLTWSNTGWILNNLLIFSGFSFYKLSLTCTNSLNFWYLFRDMMSAIIGYLVSLAQYIRKFRKLIIEMYICILISCSISSAAVFNELPVFWTLQILACSARRTFKSCFQNILKYDTDVQVSTPSGGKLKFSPLNVWTGVGDLFLRHLGSNFSHLQHFHFHFHILVLIFIFIFTLANKTVSS